MAGSGAALTDLTNLFDGSSEYTFCITRNKSSAAASFATLEVHNLEEMTSLALKFVIYFSSLGNWPGGVAPKTPPAIAEIEATICFGPVSTHFCLICCLVLDHVG